MDFSQNPKKSYGFFKTFQKLWFCAILSELLEKMSCKLQYLVIGAFKRHHKMVTFFGQMLKTPHKMLC